MSLGASAEQETEAGDAEGSTDKESSWALAIWVWWGKPQNQYFKERVLKTKEENDGFKSFLKFEDGEELWLDLEKEKAKYF